MRKSVLSAVAASALLAGIAAAQTTTTTTTTEWTNQQGTTIREYSVTKQYKSYDDPNMRPTVGMQVPESVTVYPLPETVIIPDPARYRYVIINQSPVVVETQSRRVVHVWE